MEIIRGRHHDKPFKTQLPEDFHAAHPRHIPDDAVVAHDFSTHVGGDKLELTATVGVAYWHPSPTPGEGTWEPQLIGLAERALRAAKQSGRNRMVMLQAS